MTKSNTSPRLGRAIVASTIAAFLLAPALAQSGSGLTLRGGYDSVVYASGFSAPLTALALDAQNRVFTASIDGEIRILVDADQNGVAESSTIFWPNPNLTNNLSSVTDILWIGPKLYVCHLNTVTTLEDTNFDGVADLATDIVTNIPVGFHQNNGLLFDPPNHLLITNGSATDVGRESNPLNATVLRCDLTGANLAIHATGIRNCYRLARHPVTGDVYGGDNEWNVHANGIQGDEINRIVAGGHYGFPNYFGTPPSGSADVKPVMMLPAHVAPTGLVFNPNTAISGYKNEMYLTTFTQGNSAAVARVPVWHGPVSGDPAGFAELFASGFVNPIDLEFLPDGSLLVADFSSMLVHRIFPLNDAALTIEGVPAIGQLCPIRLQSPSHPGGIVYMGASLAPQPAVVLQAPNLVVYLDIASPVFALSVTPGNGFFNFPVPGNLDAAGQYVASLAIPNLPSIVGIDVWIAYAVVDAALTPLATSAEQNVRILPIW